ncbi:NrfD/PsrC family molybdoenzyme membrane anchor subunit [Parvibacter caecicola]|uniref:Formate-dependent nitrite reductase membrane component NrfD n=1 Tax=Parvibacter caecicola TaxID=747645 RepID=A0A7W5D0H1_9ACTN|nr:NrfD/PsrC family molybdoenzyme membrane anchor subunit [Parvibacter caecicola]MBB3170634.1 formate-dependent nitrite reductase membrane component NrfD [Parvibacter caecicola]MCR2041405.1 polysulfide reductase NrfD [Parvibacter caecicola]RNL11990.1 polysulfide reductase [Parvibacter caecicola]
MTYEPIWGGIIAWYLFLAGLGGGAFITSAFLKWTKPEATTMRRIGHIVAPVAVCIGLVLLMFDAKAGFLNPLRFALLLSNFGSVMTWGVVFLAAFTIIALIVLVLDLMKKSVPNWLDIVGVVAGVCVAIYTGVLLGVCQTFPLWNNALLPILFLVSALSTGAAAVIAIGILVKPQEFNEIGLLKKTHYALPAIEILLAASLVFITAHTNQAGFNSIMNLIGGQWGAWFWIGFVIVGLLAPTIIETVTLFFSSPQFEEGATARWLSFASDAGVLVGGFLLRYLVIVAALPLTMVVPML